MQFFKINLHFGTSDNRSTCGKLNLLPINSIFLICPSPEMQRRLTDEKLLQTFLLCQKRNVSQTFKSSSYKKVFLKCVYHWYNLLWRIIFVPYNNLKTQLLYKFRVTQRFGTMAMLLRSVKKVFWKKSSFYIRYLHNNITMLVIHVFFYKKPVKGRSTENFLILLWF